jgi:mRNA interferase MazF
MKRGDILIVAEPGRLTRKPRPVVVVQSDVANAAATRVTVALVGSSGPELPGIRLAIAPDATNGLDRRSKIMADRLVTIDRASIRQRIGVVDAGTMRQVDDALRRWLDL